MKKILTFLILVFFGGGAFSQGIEIKSSANVKVTGAAIIQIDNAGLINNGTYTKGTENVIFSGTVANTISGSSNTTMNNLSVTNTGGITTQLGLLTTNQLTIASGSKLTIAATKAVTAEGSTSLGSAQCLIIKSDATGTASFIDNGTISDNSGAGTAKVERYLTPYVSVPDLKFHFISSPVGAAQLIATEFIDFGSGAITDFYKWNEPSNQWISYRLGNYGTGNYNVFNPTFADTYFTAGKGYMVAYPEIVTKNFVGKPYTDATGSGIVIPCTKTVTTGYGWNLIGNPFPSSVDWISANVTKTNVDAALYYYDNASFSYKYYVNLTGGMGTATQYIAPMQGFMVHANNATGSVTIKNTARTHSGQNVFYKNAPLTTNILDLKVEGNNQTDYARICFYEEASENFDGDFDAFKIFSYAESVSELYSVTPDLTKLAINTLPLAILDGGSIPVNFKVGTAGNYTLSAEKLNSFALNTYIILEDRVTGALQKLNDNPVYAFSASPQDAADRFVLHFKDATSVPEITTPLPIVAWYQDGQLMVKNPDGATRVDIFNLQGQNLQNFQVRDNGLRSIPINLPTGIYFARLLNDGRTQTVKMIIK